MNDDIFKGVGIEIELPSPDNFLKVRETLTRIGVASKHDNKLYQSCHILHKQGRYVILHFKELFMLDGKPSEFTEDDLGRRNTIVSLLADWKLVKVVDASDALIPKAPLSMIKVISHKEKSEWELFPKYSIGKKRD